jgi:high affinity Mn2+ porin
MDMRHVICEYAAAILMATALVAPSPAMAGEPNWLGAAPQILGFQGAVIGQRLLPMHSPYAGPNSLPGDGAGAVSQSYLVSTGSQINSRLQAYLDLRLQIGNAINNGSGLAGYVNGDFTPGAAPGVPYVYHAFLRYYAPLGTETVHVDKAIGKLPGTLPADRFELKIGRMLPTDDFDKNRYLDNPDTHFINLGLVNNPAWDYPQTNRGVTNGVVIGWYHPSWFFRIGSFQMPTTAAGPHLAAGPRARSDNAELTWQTRPGGATLHLLVYRNRARMGRYADALALARASGAPADISSSRRAGRSKTGVGMSFEVPLADSGETGLFACAGWNDGRTENFSFTESDRNVCIGGQLSGARWNRANDRLGVGLLVNGLSRPHRAYLAAGGTGIQLGDGRLNYGSERVVEAYYNYQASKQVSVGGDIQLVRNPGFNRDRGPAVILGLRLLLAL